MFLKNSNTNIISLTSPALVSSRSEVFLFIVIIVIASFACSLSGTLLSNVFVIATIGPLFEI